MSDRRVLAEIQTGASDVVEVAQRCGAGTVCGGCRETIRQMLQEFCQRTGQSPGFVSG